MNNNHVNNVNYLSNVNVNIHRGQRLASFPLRKSIDCPELPSYVRSTWHPGSEEWSLHTAQSNLYKNPTNY